MDKEQIERRLDEIVRNTPLAILGVSGYNNLSYINNFLPYSTGMEIETYKKPEFNIDNFNIIPDIVHVQCDSSEQRFRIPNGAKGLICLWNICTELKQNSYVNDETSIHYHIDMTDCFSRVNQKFIDDNNSWIIDLVDKWGDFNPYYKVCSFERGWVRYAEERRTLEIRLGTISFEYSVMIKEIIEANQIVRKLKEKLGVTIEPTFQDIDRAKIMAYLKLNKSQQKIKDAKAKLKVKKVVVKEEVLDSSAIIKNRVNFI